MKLKSIPPRTYLDLMHKNSRRTPTPFRTEIKGSRGHLHKQISRKPFEDKLNGLRGDLEDLKMFAEDGFDVEIFRHQTQKQIEQLQTFLGDDINELREKDGVL